MSPPTAPDSADPTIQSGQRARDTTTSSPLGKLTEQERDPKPQLLSLIPVRQK